ncbi:MAG: hypothetical protein RIT27_2381 [Pseudomonadota bacterium]|jgi:glycosyltransferase involved in cell wall biosynthesis
MNENKLNLLVLTSTFPRWEGDKEPPFVFELSKRLIEGFNVHVLTPHFPLAKHKENLANLSITRFKYFFTNFQTLAYNGGILANLKRNIGLYFLIPFFLIGESIALYKLLKEKNFAVIHAHWIIPQGLIAVLITRLMKRKVPILCTSHGGDLYGLNNRFLKKLKSYVLNKVDKITVVSQAMKQEVLNLGISEDKIQVISMGVDLQQTFVPNNQIQKAKESILFVGRLVEKKGVNYLLEAFAKIIEKYPHAKLNIVGTGTEEQTLKQQAKTLDIERYVSFLGAIENSQLPVLYQQTELVVFPSVIGKDGDREGFGLVLVEALGCECAIIATDLLAMQDILTHGENALIVPQKNVEQLANKLDELLNNTPLQKTLGKNGRAFVLINYDWKIIANRYDELLNNCVIR